MWPFKKKPESPEEIAAEEKLDEATREVASAELQKEADRQLSTAFNPEFEHGMAVPGPDAVLGRFRKFRWKKGDAVPEPVDDEDPGGGPSMHDLMHGAHVDDKARGTHVEDDEN
jgi:hypothetical protein